MKQRIITAVISFILFIPIIVFAGTYILNIAIAILATIAAYEALSLIPKNEGKVYKVIGMIFSGGLPLIIPFIKVPLSTIIVLFTGLFLLVFLVYNFTKDKFSFVNTSAAYLLTMYVSLLFTTIILVAEVEKVGIELFFMILLGAWLTDIFAYFTGVFFGKHKLCPNISPKKTIEGSIGGTVFTVLGFILYGFIVTKCLPIVVNYIALIICGFLCAIFSQAGDLFASLVKRHYGVKDYGNILPGHGGILDRFDSVLFVAPVIYIFTSWFPIFYFL